MGKARRERQANEAAKEAVAKETTLVQLTWAERAGLFIIASNIVTKGIPEGRTSSKTLDAIEGGDEGWSKFSELDVINNVGKGEVDTRIAISGDSVRFILEKGFGELNLRATFLRRVVTAIDKLQAVRDGSYQLPGEEDEDEGEDEDAETETAETDGGDGVSTQPI